MTPIRWGDVTVPYTATGPGWTAPTGRWMHDRDSSLDIIRRATPDERDAALAREAEAFRTLPLPAHQSAGDEK